jgi:hypothetical protein
VKNKKLSVFFLFVLFWFVLLLLSIRVLVIRSCGCVFLSSNLSICRSSYVRLSYSFVFVAAVNVILYSVVVIIPAFLQLISMIDL